MTANPKVPTPDEIAAIRARRATLYLVGDYAEIGPDIDTLLAVVDQQAATIRTLREALRKVWLESENALAASAERPGAEAMSDERHFSRHGKTLHAFLCYPRVEGNPTHVIVELEDVRAADSVRLSYDFERDGWKIEQASTFEWDMDDEVCDPDWQEVAFVKAWAREKPTDAR